MGYITNGMHLKDAIDQGLQLNPNSKYVLKSDLTIHEYNRFLKIFIEVDKKSNHHSYSVKNVQRNLKEFIREEGLGKDEIEKIDSIVSPILKNQFDVVGSYPRKILKNPPLVTHKELSLDKSKVVKSGMHLQDAMHNNLCLDPDKQYVIKSDLTIHEFNEARKFLIWVDKMRGLKTYDRYEIEKNLKEMDGHMDLSSVMEILEKQPELIDPPPQKIRYYRNNPNPTFNLFKIMGGGKKKTRDPGPHPVTDFLNLALGV